MFIALYEFKVKSGYEEQFETNWKIVTEAIYKSRGSLGSRLHKSVEGTYIAYAQWPSENQFNLDIPLPELAQRALALMKDACNEQKILKLMTVTSDLLKN